MSLIHVLVVEDDAAIRMGVCDALESAKYVATAVDSGEQAISMVQRTAFDLVLLDVVLPGQDGMQVIRTIREMSPSLPVIMLTARGDVKDRIRGLGLGADDYVVKPFNVGELLARVEAVLRRAPVQPSAQTFELPSGASIDSYKRCVHHTDGSTVTLSEKESDLLRYLCARRGQIVGRDELIERIWGINPKGLHTRTVDMHIARLREKIGDNQSESPWIVTVRGRGYCFAPEAGP
jgi:DNA-binding response OmpR family regulator